MSGLIRFKGKYLGTVSGMADFTRWLIHTEYQPSFTKWCAANDLTPSPDHMLEWAKQTTLQQNGRYWLSKDQGGNFDIFDVNARENQT